MEIISDIDKLLNNKESINTLISTINQNLSILTSIGYMVQVYGEYIPFEEIIEELYTKKNEIKRYFDQQFKKHKNKAYQYVKNKFFEKYNTMFIYEKEGSESIYAYYMHTYANKNESGTIILNIKYLTITLDTDPETARLSTPRCDFIPYINPDQFEKVLDLKLPTSNGNLQWNYLEFVTGSIPKQLKNKGLDNKDCLYIPTLYGGGGMGTIVLCIAANLAYESLMKKAFTLDASATGAFQPMTTYQLKNTFYPKFGFELVDKNKKESEEAAKMYALLEDIIKKERCLKVIKSD
jgi:hypothetical protein